jgi:Zn finger protein HypA/HybF involved in hydrogenase expression
MTAVANNAKHLINFETGKSACGERESGLGEKTFAREPKCNRCPKCQQVYASSSVLNAK